MNKVTYPVKMYVEFHGKFEVPKENVPLLLAIRPNGIIGYITGRYAKPTSYITNRGCFYHDIAGVQPFTTETPYFIGWMYLSELDPFVEKTVKEIEE